MFFKLVTGLNKTAKIPGSMFYNRKWGVLLPKLKSKSFERKVTTQNFVVWLMVLNCVIGVGIGSLKFRGEENLCDFNNILKKKLFIKKSSFISILL